MDCFVLDSSSIGDFVRKDSVLSNRRPLLTCPFSLRKPLLLLNVGSRSRRARNIPVSNPCPSHNVLHTCLETSTADISGGGCWMERKSQSSTIGPKIEYLRMC